MDLTNPSDTKKQQRQLKSRVSIRDVTVLNSEEYSNSVNNQPNWYNTKSNADIIQITLYDDPDPILLKEINELLTQAKQKLQIQYIERQDTAYICPTNNSFKTI